MLRVFSFVIATVVKNLESFISLWIWSHIAVCSVAGTSTAIDIAADCHQQELAVSSASCIRRAARVVSKTKYSISATALQCLATDKYRPYVST